MKKWFYLKKNKIQGPVPTEQISQWLSEKKIGIFDLLFLEGDSKWRQIQDFKHFRDVLKDVEVESADKMWVVLVKKPEEKGKGYSQLGPFGTKEIIKKVNSGELKYTDYIWKEGMNEWYRISHLDDFSPTPKPKIPQENPAPPPIPEEPKGKVLKRIKKQKREKKVGLNVKIPEEAEKTDLVEKALEYQSSSILSDPNTLEGFIPEQTSKSEAKKKYKVKMDSVLASDPNTDIKIVKELGDAADIDVEPKTDVTKGDSEITETNVTEVEATTGGQKTLAVETQHVHNTKGPLKNVKTQKMPTPSIDVKDSIDEFEDPFASKKKFKFTQDMMIQVLIFVFLAMIALLVFAFWPKEKNIDGSAKVSSKPVSRPAISQLAKSKPQQFVAPKKSNIKPKPLVKKKVPIAKKRLPIKKPSYFTLLGVDLRTKKPKLRINTDGTSPHKIKLKIVSKPQDNITAKGFIKEISVKLKPKTILDLKSLGLTRGYYRVSASFGKVKESQKLSVGKLDQKYLTDMKKQRKNISYFLQKEKASLFLLSDQIIKSTEKLRSFTSKDMKSWRAQYNKWKRDFKKTNWDYVRRVSTTNSRGYVLPGEWLKLKKLRGELAVAMNQLNRDKSSGRKVSFKEISDHLAQIKNIKRKAPRITFWK